MFLLLLLLFYINSKPAIAYIYVMNQGSTRGQSIPAKD